MGTNGSARGKFLNLVLRKIFWYLNAFNKAFPNEQRYLDQKSLLSLSIKVPQYLNKKKT